MPDNAGKARTNTLVTFFYGLWHRDVTVLADQRELIYISSVLTQDVVWKTLRERGKIVTDGKKELGKSVLSAWLDDDHHHHHEWDDLSSRHKWLYTGWHAVKINQSISRSINIYIYIYIEREREREGGHIWWCNG